MPTVPINPTDTQLANRTAATTTAPTVGSIYGGISSSDQSLNDATAGYATAAQTPVDEAAVRSNVLDSLNSEINATHQIYAQKLNEAKIAGESRAGSTAAINARSGLLGSDFGAAAADKTNTLNNDVYSGIGQEEAAAIAAINDKGNSLATTEINNKNSVRQQSAQDYINFLSKSEDRRTSRTQDAASRAVAAGIDLTTASPDTIKSIASSYQISPDALVSSYVSAKNSAAAAQKASLVTAPITDSVLKPDGKGGYTTVQQGTATPDSALKEYQYAVTNDGYTGSLADWNAEKANQKVSNSVTHDPITGALQVVQRAGPQVAGTGTKSTALPSGSSSTAPASLPTATTKPTPAIPATGTVSNPYDKLSGSDLAYAQSGAPAQAKFKYPGQVDAATARIRALIPDWSPANAAAQFSFFKSPTTQQFIANSNTVLNTLDQIKTLSSKVPRGSIQILNNGQFALATGVSDPNAAKLVQLATIAGDEAGKLLGGSGGSDFTTALGISLVNPKYSDATFGATIDQLGGRVRNKVSEYYVQGGQTNPNAGSGGTASTPKGALSDSDFVSQALTAQGIDYNHVVSTVPAGQIPVLLNSSGQVGYIPPNEFDPGAYTKL